MQSNKYVYIKKIYFITIVISIVFMLIIMFCRINNSNIDYLNHTEVIARITSPDSLVDAIILRKGGNATVGFSYQVYLVQAGLNPENNTHIFYTDKCDSISIKWKKSKLLEILYKNSRITNFRNYWQHKQLNNYKYVVNIILHQLDI